MGGHLTIVVAYIEPAQAKRSIHAQAVFRHERNRCKACGSAVVQATGTEAYIVLVGHFAGHEELPVNLKDAVALNRVGRRVHLNVLTRVVGVREHITVLPRERGPVGHGARHQRQFGTDHGGGIFTDDVASHHLVGRDSLVKDFAFRDGDVEVHRLHRVGDLERFKNQNSGRF